MNQTGENNMASVRMSESLRNKIQRNFEEQIRTAYSNSSELQPFVQNLINSSISDDRTSVN